MNEPQEPKPPLVTRLLILSDGMVLADNLTPVMAAVLSELGLKPVLETQRTLRRRGATVRDGNRGRRSSIQVRVESSTSRTMNITKQGPA